MSFQKLKKSNSKVLKRKEEIDIKKKINKKKQMKFSKQIPNKFNNKLRSKQIMSKNHKIIKIKTLIYTQRNQLIKRNLKITKINLSKDKNHIEKNKLNNLILLYIYNEF